MHTNYPHPYLLVVACLHCMYLPRHKRTGCAWLYCVCVRLHLHRSLPFKHRRTSWRPLESIRCLNPVARTSVPLCSLLVMYPSRFVHEQAQTSKSHRMHAHLTSTNSLTPSPFCSLDFACLLSHFYVLRQTLLDVKTG